MISRRSFFTESLAVVSLGIAVPTIFGRAVVAAAEQTNSLSVSGKTLIVVQLAGGVDGLNVVVPYNDPAYRQNRPTLGVAEKDLIPVDDRIAFHPSLAKLKGLFDANQLAVVEGVGYPNPNFSHFRAMDIWQSADPQGVAKEGWLGAYFDGLVDGDGHPLEGLSVGRSLPSAFNSAKSSIPAVESLDSFNLQPAFNDKDPSVRSASLAKLYEIYKPANTPFAALLDTTLENSIASAAGLSAAHAAYKPAVTYPNSSLASGLQLLAELIDSGGPGQSPLRVGHVSVGSFDTHTQETTRLNTLLTQTSEGLAAFWQDIVGHGHGDDVIVMTWSEFGRRVKENAQDGTDHGSAGPMFVIGNAVKPGFHGEPPDLANLDDGNLKFTTDFRSVYATLLEKWLQSPSDDILHGHFDTIDLLNV